MAYALQFVLCAVVVLLAGCAGDEERAANATFGESVRHTIALQTANPGTAGTGLDAVKAGAALEAYRKDVGSRSAVGQTLSVKAP